MNEQLKEVIKAIKESKQGLVNTQKKLLLAIKKRIKK
jgi:hypothetical protein